MIGRRALLRMLPMAPAAPALAAKAIKAAASDVETTPRQGGLHGVGHGPICDSTHGGGGFARLHRAVGMQQRRLDLASEQAIEAVKSKRSWSTAFKAHVVAQIIEEKEAASYGLSALIHDMGEEGRRKLAALLGVDW